MIIYRILIIFGLIGLTIQLPSGDVDYDEDERIKRLIDSIFIKDMAINSGNYHPHNEQVKIHSNFQNENNKKDDEQYDKSDNEDSSSDDCPVDECVAQHLCANNTIITDGNGFIDVRFDPDEPKKCHYLEVCCAETDRLIEPVRPIIKKKYTCGNRYSDGIGFRITSSDHESQYGEFPWMIAVLKEEKSSDENINIYQCGGALIHPKVILTAAHCVSGKSIKNMKIRAGEWDTQTLNEIWPHQDRKVKKIIIHENFYHGGLFNDIALIILDYQLEINENVQTICLPPQNYNFDHKNCVASGWGKDLYGATGKYQVILKKIDLPIVPRGQCQMSLRKTRLGKHFNLHESFICAGGEKGKDTCKGDGGSPLVCPISSNNRGGNDKQYYQAGIVAWGIGCGENMVPGVYVNIASFRKWIDRHFHKMKFDTSYYNAV